MHQLGAISQEKPEVDDTSYYFISELEPVGLNRLSNHIQGIGTTKVAHVKVVLSFFLEVDWIVAVSLLSHSGVHHLATITWENGPFARLESEMVGESFREAVDKVGACLGTNLKIVVGKDNVSAVGVEQDRAILLAGNFETEGAVGIFKHKIGQINWERESSIGVSGEYPPLRHLVSIFSPIKDLEVEI